MGKGRKNTGRGFLCPLLKASCCSVSQQR